MPRRKSKAAKKQQASKRVSERASNAAASVNPYGVGHITGRLREADGTPLVDPADIAQPTEPVMCHGADRPTASYFVDLENIENVGLYTYDLRCTDTKISDDAYLENVREGQHVVSQFLNKVLFDLHVIDSFTTRHKTTFKHRFEQPNGHRKKRQLTSAFNELSHAHAAIERELRWCTEQVAGVPAVPESVRAVRGTLEQYGCSPGLTQRLYDVGRLLYYRKMKRVKQLFREVVSGFDVEKHEDEWDDYLDDDDDNLEFSGLGLLSKHLQYTYKRVAARFSGVRNVTTAADVGGTVAAMAMAAVGGKKAMTFRALTFVAGGYASTIAAPVYLCFFARELEFYVQSANLLQDQLWNWTTGEGEVSYTFQRVFESFAALGPSGETQSALSRAAESGGEVTELQKRAVNPTRGRIGSMFKALIDALNRVLSNDQIRGFLDVCKTAVDTSISAFMRSASSVNTAEALAIGKGARILERGVGHVPVDVERMWAGSLEDMAELVDKVPDIAPKAVNDMINLPATVANKVTGTVTGAVDRVTGAVGSARDAFLNLSPNIAFWKWGGEDMVNAKAGTFRRMSDEGEPWDRVPEDDEVIIPAHVLTDRDPAVVQKVLDKYLTPEKQQELRDAYANAHTTMVGYLTAAGDFVEQRTGYTVEQLNTGASHIGTYLLYTAYVMAAAGAFTTSIENPLVFTEEAVAEMEAIAAARGDAAEQTLLYYGRVNPIPNPQAVYDRCVTTGRSHEACLEVVRRATAFECTDRGCRSPDPLIRSSTSTARTTLPTSFQ